MFTRVISTGLLLALTLSPGQQPCHFAVELEVKGASAEKTARTSTPCLPLAESHRPLLEVTSGEKVAITWTVTALVKNAKPLNDVIVHSFVAREAELGQTRLPPLDEAAILETALLMDFSPSDSSRGAFEIVLDEPGDYLVRVETMGLAEKVSHEHCVALDVKVVPAREKRAEVNDKERGQ